MDFDYIEELVKNIKNGDSLCKEKLITQFDPFIKNLCKKTFVDGYELEDLINECYTTLLNSINKYNIENHRFVAYGTKSIKTSLYSLIHKKNILKEIDGTSSLWESTNMEYFLKSSDDSVDSNIISLHEKACLKEAIKKLSTEEKDILINTVLNNTTSKTYSKIKEIPYSTVLRKRKKVVNKLSNSIKNDFLN